MEGLNEVLKIAKEDNFKKAMSTFDNLKIDNEKLFLANREMYKNIKIYKRHQPWY